MSPDRKADGMERSDASAVVDRRVAPETGNGLTRSDRAELLRYMLMMRASEERALTLYKQGKVPGSFYDGRGQEAISVGAAWAMEPTDRLCILHRDLGAHFVRGVTPDRYLANYMGRSGGVTGGREGNLHFGDRQLGCVGMVSMLPDMALVANGLALSMKIAINLSLAVQMLAFSEGVLLAEKSGIARETAVDVMTHSVIGSPMVQYRGPMVLNMPDEAWFDVNMMQKDMLLALEMGRQLHVPLPTTAVTNEMLTAARGMGLAKKDFAVIFQVLARMAGVQK